MGDMEENLKYAGFVKNYEKSTEEEKAAANLYSAKAYIEKGNIEAAKKELVAASTTSQTAIGAEAKYTLGKIQYDQKEFKTAQETAFDLIKTMPSHDYWVAKSFILLADTYLALKDEFQAKSTLESIDRKSFV